MTEKLRTLLHDRASGVDLPPPDLDSLVAAGDRRVRRRRGAAVLGGAAAFAVAGVLVVSTLGGGGGDGTTVAASRALPLPTGVFSYASGSVLHAGGEQADLGVNVSAYVATDDGYVVAGSDGVVRLLAEGRLSEIGRLDPDSPRLVGDHGSSLVGWVSTEGEAPAFVVYDLATGSRVLEDDSATVAGMDALADGHDPAYFYALDHGTAYWRDQRGAVAVDVMSGEVTVLDREAANGFDLVDVQSRVLVLSGQDGIEVGTSVQDARPLGAVLEGNGYLSPSGERYAPDAETLTVLGVDDGADLSPHLDGYFFSTVYEWVDDQTVRVIAMRDEASRPDLLSCTVPAGACEVLVEGAAPQGELQLPVGFTIGDR